MSNSKWIKLISTLIENSSSIKQCKVKPIWDDAKPSRRLCFDEKTQYGFDYYDTAMEAMVSGKPTGWYTYKEIEWLDFPKFIPDEGNTQQDLAFIQDLLKSLGQFHLELTEDNLRLYAYLKAHN